ncbi:MAG: histone [Thermoprotei archaeon]|nr:MAG: histone [Thermoprotei archaeon]RLF03487.1 MAG: histone [Thermoprotei archaeon]
MRGIPLAPLERIFRTVGAERVSREALVYLKEILEEIAEEIAKEAVDLVRFSNRKTITKEDVDYAKRRVFRIFYLAEGRGGKKF